MISRRPRLKVCPNLSAAVRLGGAQRQKPIVPVLPSQGSLSTPSVDGSQSLADAGLTSASSRTPVVARRSPPNTVPPSKCNRSPFAMKVEQLGRSASPLKSPKKRTPRARPGTPKTPKSCCDEHLEPRSPRCSVRSPRTFPRCDDRKIRKKFTGNEPLNAKKMRMFDLISWNPKNEQGLETSNIKRKDMIWPVKKDEGCDPGKEIVSSTKAIAAPQVRVAEDGSLVVDETSLTVEKKNPLATCVFETVNEDRFAHNVTSLSFRKTPCRKAMPWSKCETELFYEILRATGPDFSLMHEFFPLRSRSELKCKFNREERRNWDRVKDVSANPSTLGDHLYETVAKKMKGVKKNGHKEKDGKELRKTGQCSKVKVEWSEESADLVAEAEAQIRLLMAEEKQSEEADKKKKEEEEESGEELDPLAALSDHFPPFELVYEESRDAVVLEPNPSGGSPVVRLPVGTQVDVRPPTATDPEQVFLRCPQLGDSPQRVYAILHQESSPESSRGCLVLYGTE